MNCYVIRQVSYLLFALYTIISCVVESQEFTLAFFNLGKRGNCRPPGTVFRLTYIVQHAWRVMHICTQIFIKRFVLETQRYHFWPIVSRAFTLRFFFFFPFSFDNKLVLIHSLSVICFPMWPTAYIWETAAWLWERSCSLEKGSEAESSPLAWALGTNQLMC